MRALVTGATGNAGREVVGALRAAGVPLRAAVREPADEEGEAVAFDFRDPATWRTAARGCDRLFLLRPPAIADVKQTLNPFVDVAREEGIDHVVFLSVAGAGDNRFIPHHAVEQHLAERSAAWTSLRVGFFAQNLQDAYLDDIRDRDRLYVPVDDGEAAFVDLRDVAEVVAEVLRDPRPHAASAYHLTGRAALSFDEVAALLTEASGRAIAYEPASVLGYARHVRRAGRPWGAAVVQTALHWLLRRGQGAAVDPTLEALLGRPPRTMRDYVFDHAHLWSTGPR